MFASRFSDSSSALSVRTMCAALSTGLLNCRAYVCPSVRLSRPAAARRCCGFAAVGPAPRRHRSIAARPAGRRSPAAARPNAGSATLSADVRSWTQTVVRVSLSVAMYRGCCLMHQPVGRYRCSKQKEFCNLEREFLTYRKSFRI